MLGILLLWKRLRRSLTMPLKTSALVVPPCFARPGDEWLLAWRFRPLCLRSRRTHIFAISSNSSYYGCDPKDPVSIALDRRLRTSFCTSLVCSIEGCFFFENASVVCFCNRSNTSSRSDDPPDPLGEGGCFGFCLEGLAILSLSLIHI